jgi:hypothetical protein
MTARPLALECYYCSKEITCPTQRLALRAITPHMTTVTARYLSIAACSEIMQQASSVNERTSVLLKPDKGLRSPQATR